MPRTHPAPTAPAVPVRADAPAAPAPQPRRWGLLVALWLAAPLALFVSWGLTLESGLAEPELTLRMLADPVLGIVALLLVPRVLHRDSGPPHYAVDARRERRALWFGVGTIACGGLSGMALVPAGVALVSLAGRRRPAWIAAGVGALALAAVLDITIAGDPGLAWWEYAIAVVLVAAVLVLVGLQRGGRRELMASLRREAESARRASEAVEQQTREAERTRIAREMHDTVSHRLALVALHAGALEYRDDLSPDQVRDAAGVIRAGVQEAQDELRSTLRVLRSDGADARPAPTVADLAALADDVRAAGTPVELTLALPEDATPADHLAGHVHRVVQESLTNAVKHAPGLPVRVVVEGEVGDGVRVEVRNPLPPRRVDAAGSRLGLIGLRERMDLVGGTFAAGPQGSEFVVRAWVPWTN